jgi:hypothetical protein
MQARKRLGQPFIVSRQPTKACGPGVPALSPPPAGQQDKAFFRLGQLDHVQTSMLGLGILGGVRPRLPRVPKGHCDRLAGDLLYCGGQPRDLAPVLLAGRQALPPQGDPPPWQARNGHH